MNKILLYIEEKQINKKIRIINSLENVFREEQDCDFIK